MMMLNNNAAATKTAKLGNQQISIVRRNCADCNRVLCGCPDTGCDHRCCMCDQPVCGMCSRKLNSGEEEEEEEEKDGLVIIGNQQQNGRGRELANNSNYETNYLSPLSLVRDLRVCGRCSV